MGAGNSLRNGSTCTGENVVFVFVQALPDRNESAFVAQVPSLMSLAVCHMMNLEPFGMTILDIFLATAYLAEKMSPILNLMSASQES